MFVVAFRAILFFCVGAVLLRGRLLTLFKAHLAVNEVSGLVMKPGALLMECLVTLLAEAVPTIKAVALCRRSAIFHTIQETWGIVIKCDTRVVKVELVLIPLPISREC